MISGKELFAEISNEAVTEDGEVVGYFVKNSRMNLLEQMLCSTVTVKLPPYSFFDFKAGCGFASGAWVNVEALSAACAAVGIKWEAE